MKTILTLQGDKDTGKSQTIGILLENVRISGYTIIQDKKRKGSHDFFVILEKKHKKIGLCTYGDVKSLILAKVEIFIKIQCEVIVCACHKKGATVRALESVTGYSVEYLAKTVAAKSTDRSDCNKRDAERLLARIESLLL